MCSAKLRARRVIELVVASDSDAVHHDGCRAMVGKSVPITAREDNTGIRRSLDDPLST